MTKEQPKISHTMCNAMMGSQDNNISGVYFHIDYQYTPTPELGPLHVLQYHQVFNVKCQSESEPEEETEQDEGIPSMTRNNDPYTGWVWNMLAENGSQVVGPNQGPTPPNLSSHSLFQWRRERERAWYMQFFFCKYNPLQAVQH